MKLNQSRLQMAAWAVLIAFSLVSAGCTSDNGNNGTGTPEDSTGTHTDTTKTDTSGSTERHGEMRLQGVDVSHDQGEINWEAVKQSDVVFAYAKATEGMTGVDPRFAANWDGMKAAGIFRGAYHFYRVGDDAEKQVKHFLKQFQPGEGDLIPMLDVEQASIPEGVRIDKKALQQAILVWLDQVEEALGCKPIVYTDVNFANSYLDDPTFATYDLWIAEYGVEEPKIPTVWGNENWTVWQYSSDGSIPGIGENVDRDQYHSDLAEFKSEMLCPVE